MQHEFKVVTRVQIIISTRAVKVSFVLPFSMMFFSCKFLISNNMISSGVNKHF